jgi:hypothetical protein
MGVVYMDPLMIRTYTVKLNESETLGSLIVFLDKHHDNGVILLPYNFG